VRVSIPVLALLTVAALALASAVVSSGRSDITLQTSAASYCSGDTVRFTLANDSDSSFWMNSTPSWRIRSVSPDTLIFPYYVFWLMWSLGPDSSLTFEWDQKDYHGNQVPQGSYYVTVSGSLGMTGPAASAADTFNITGASATDRVSWSGLKAGWK
jgi:hypothetical protein